MPPANSMPRMVRAAGRCCACVREIPPRPRGFRSISSEASTKLQSVRLLFGAGGAGKAGRAGDDRMTTGRQMLIVGLLLLAVVCAALTHFAVRAAESLPARLSDQEFWRLTEDLSEPNGYFQSDNLLSNEI